MSLFAIILSGLLFCYSCLFADEQQNIPSEDNQKSKQWQQQQIDRSEREVKIDQMRRDKARIEEQIQQRRREEQRVEDRIQEERRLERQREDARRT